MIPSCSFLPIFQSVYPFIKTPKMSAYAWFSPESSVPLPCEYPPNTLCVYSCPKISQSFDCNNNHMLLSYYNKHQQQLDRH